VRVEERFELYQLCCPRDQLQNRLLRRRMGGKTTNLQYIYQKTAEQQKGKMISLATETERTLFFDFLPLDLGSVRGFKTRIHLYTVPGQVFYDASRKLILRGVDGIVFVPIRRKSAWTLMSRRLKISWRTSRSTATTSERFRMSCN